MSLPKTFTRNVIHEALTQSLKKSIDIKELLVQTYKPGGNYCSDIYRITVKFTVDNHEEQPQELKLVLKDFYDYLSEFSREFYVYQTVLPEMNAIFGAMQDGGRFSPRVYLMRRDSNEQYLLEDLNANGYILCDHLLGYNEAQTKCILEKLGQFHATSIVFQEKHPKTVAEMKTWKHLYCNLINFCEKMITGNVAYVTKIVEKWPQFAQIAEKMRVNTGATFRRKFLSTLERQDYQIRVIVHGDFKIRNILVLENAEKIPIDAIFVDYQLNYLGSPGIDFTNFLITSVQLDVMNSEEKRNALIHHYYQSFKKTLLCLGYDIELIPTLQMLMDEITLSEYYLYYCLLFSLPLNVLCKNLAKDMNFAAFMDDERMAVNRKDMFCNERVLATYKYMLPRLDKLGLLD